MKVLDGLSQCFIIDETLHVLSTRTKICFSRHKLFSLWHYILCCFFHQVDCQHPIDAKNALTEQQSEVPSNVSDEVVNVIYCILK